MSCSQGNIPRNNRFYGRDGDDILDDGYNRGEDPDGLGNSFLAGGLGDDSYIIYAPAGIDADHIIGYDDAGGIDAFDFSAVTTGGIILDMKSPSALVYYEVNRLSGVAGLQLVQGLEVSDSFDHGDWIENFIGTTSADTITGNSLDNTISGGGGDDILRGGDGNDHLVGGLENDQLFGEAGNDVLYGGEGLYDVYNGGNGVDFADDPDVSDIDTDGLANLDEPAAGTDATDGDTDDDDLADGFEADYDGPGSLDPTTADSDGDGTPDGQEDADADGASNSDEQSGGTDPTNSSSTPSGNPAQWRTYGDAIIDDGILTVGQIGVSENSTQAAVLPQSELEFPFAAVSITPEGEPFHESSAEPVRHVPAIPPLCIAKAARDYNAGTPESACRVEIEHWQQQEKAQQMRQWLQGFSRRIEQRGAAVASAQAYRPLGGFCPGSTIGEGFALPKDRISGVDK